MASGQQAGQGVARSKRGSEGADVGSGACLHAKGNHGGSAREAELGKRMDACTGERT